MYIITLRSTLLLYNCNIWQGVVNIIRVHLMIDCFFKYNNLVG